MKGLEATPRIINGVSHVHTTSSSAGGVRPPMTVIPSYPDLPMEDVYPRVPKTDDPAVHVVQFGSGRVVYFPWDIDRTFWEVLSTDHLTLLRNAVEWVTNEPRPVEVTGPGILDITVWRQHSSMTVHLVNLTNPMMMKGPIREVIPLPGQEVRILSLPPGVKVAGVKLLVSGRPADFRAVGQSIELAIPSIGLHEVIAIDFA